MCHGRALSVDSIAPGREFTNSPLWGDSEVPYLRADPPASSRRSSPAIPGAGATCCYSSSAGGLCLHREWYVARSSWAGQLGHGRRTSAGQRRSSRLRPRRRSSRTQRPSRFHGSVVTGQTPRALIPARGWTHRRAAVPVQDRLTARAMLDDHVRVDDAHRRKRGPLRPRVVVCVDRHDGFDIVLSRFPDRNCCPAMRPFRLPSVSRTRFRRLGVCAGACRGQGRSSGGALHLDGSCASARWARSRSRVGLRTGLGAG